jgi:hypothetical protein
MEVLELLLPSQVFLKSIQDGYVDEYGGASLAGLSNHASLITKRHLQIDTNSV